MGARLYSKLPTLYPSYSALSGLYGGLGANDYGDLQPLTYATVKSTYPTYADVLTIPDRTGSVLGSSTITATISPTPAMGGTASGISSGTGYVVGAEGDLGIIIGTSSNTGQAAGSPGFFGSATGSESSSGSVTGTEGDLGQVSGVAVSSGQVTGAPQLLGAVSGSESSTGSVTGSEGDLGLISSTIISQGTASGSPAFSGQSFGQSTTTGTVVGEATQTAPAQVGGGARQTVTPMRTPPARRGSVVGFTFTSGQVSGQVGRSGAARDVITLAEVIHLGAPTRTGSTAGDSLDTQAIVFGLPGRSQRQRDEEVLLLLAGVA